MPPFGPIYCETPSIVTGFPAEPTNTISNIAVVLGLLAFVHVARKAPRSWDLYLLSFFLLAVGIGSTLWHGLRQPWALTLDFVPGLLFFLALALLWARRVYSWLGAGAFFVAFFAAVFAAMYFGVRLLHVPFFVPLAPVVITFSTVLIVKTARLSREAAWMAAGSVALALVALTFRSIDLKTCDVIPFGTHFLWHICLASAAYVGVWTLMILDRAKML